jgi:hypothetical protein
VSRPPRTPAVGQPTDQVGPAPTPGAGPDIVGAMRRVLPLALATSLLACGGEAPAPGGEARIVSFTARPATVAPGGTTTLTWQASGTTGVNIEPRVGLQPASGSVQVTPFVTTVYKLSIPGGPLDLVAEATVTVEGGAPKVTGFTATPRTIGEGEQSTLQWSTTGADRVLIEPEVGELDAPEGSFQVAPEVTTTYRLTALAGTLLSEPAEVTVVVASGNQPFIKRFSATPQSVDAGDGVTLTWETENADRVTVDNGVGVQPISGTVQVFPTQTTTYNLSASGPGGQANASVTVNVITGRDPSVLRFTATPATVSPGGDVLLDWDTDSADGVNIDNGVGARPAKGMFTVRPQQSTTYTLVAYGNNKEATAQVSVTVAQAGAPVVSSFAAQPAAILVGGSTTLTWATQNATLVDISGVGGGLMASGSVTVSPTQTTTYDLTARNAAGDVATAQVTVEVTEAPPSVVTFNAQPASVNAGQSTTLAWTTQGATGVTIDNGVGAQPATGMVTVSPGQTTTYALTATGPGGMTTAQVTVTVTPVGAPAIAAFSATPQQIAPGAQASLSWQVSNATSVSIDNGVGTQPMSGSVMVSPNQTTTYTLTAVGAGGQTSAQTTVTVASVVGETCADPFVIGASGVFTGNTNLAVNDYSQSAACTGYSSTGPDVVYRISLQAGDRLQASLQPSNGSWDASIYLVTGCQNIGTSCVAGQDNGNPEELDYTAASTGDYFLVVDGFGGQGGNYALTVNLTAAPIANDTCAGAINATAGGTFTGDTTNAQPNYTPLASGLGGCTGYTAQGNDVVYRVTLSAGERLQASLSATWDASLYMVTDCANPSGTCVAGQDNGNPETIDFTAPGAGGYFLVVDGYGSARGAFSLTVSITPPATGGDTCQAPVMVPAAGGLFSASTSGLANDYNPGAACTGQTTAGPDMVYAMSLAAGDVVEAFALFDPGVNGALYVVQDCSNLSCIAADDTTGPGDIEVVRFVASAAGTHYVVVDGRAAGDAGGHDIDLTRYTGETCPDAPDLIGSELAITTGRVNDYSPNAGGCTRSSSGPDRAYRVPVQAGDQVHVQLTPDANWDATLYMVGNCGDITGSCVAGADAGNRGGAEQIAPVFDQSGTYYLVVDGWAGGAGRGTLTAQIHRGDTCADAYVVPGSGGTFAGTTAGYAADYGTTVNAGSCTNYAQAGADAVYAVDLEPGETLDASLNATGWDGALYLIADCAASTTTCVAGSDAGNPETLSFTHSGAVATRYYLVVDSWRTSDASGTREGRYTLTIGIQ